jgi:ribonuclease HII
LYWAKPPEKEPVVTRSTKPLPTLNTEHRLWQTGYGWVAGVDEVGRGALAGPVVAAALMLPAGAPLAGVWSEVGDSKLISPARRIALVPRIQEAALCWGIGAVEAAVIDAVGIATATRQAMMAAVEALAPRPDFLLLDWVRLPQLNIAQESRVRADQEIVSVAAASILAKVHRDALMVALHERYPAYGFAANKGYGTAAHLAALKQHGPCCEHRHSFAPVARPATRFVASS